MAVVRESIELPAAPEVVWDLLVDWPRQGEWMPGTVVRPLDPGGGTGVGGRIEGWSGVGPFGVRDPMEIRVWQPPRLVVMRHLGRVVRGAGAFELEETGPGRCRFAWSEWLELPGGALGRAAWPVVRPVARALTRLSLRRLAALVAAEQGISRQPGEGG